MAKLTRKAYAIYIDSTFGGPTPNWFLIGKDINDLSVELSPDVQVQKNILDETTAVDNGYEPKVSADPYYANPDDAIYSKIKNIAMNRLTGDDCKTKILEVIISDTGAATHEAYIEDVLVKPTKYGGDTSGVQIPFDVYFDGNRQNGNVAIANKIPTFTPATGTLKKLYADVVAGTSGKTKVSAVVGKTLESNLMYKIAASLYVPAYGDATTGYTALTVGTDVAATAGNKIIIVEKNTGGTVIAASDVMNVVVG